MTSQHAAAIAAYQIGFSIFPLFPSTKDPHREFLPRIPNSEGKLKPSWKPFQTQRATWQEVELWFSCQPNCNYGIAVGRLSGFFVVDADTQEAKEWFEAKLPICGPVVQTSQSWKRQYYFAHPGFDTQNSASKIFPGLDIRGDGGFVVGAGSIHPNGSTYQYLVSPDEIALPIAPDWLLDAVRKPEPMPVMSEPVRLDPLDPSATRYERYSMGALQSAVRRLMACPDNAKENTLFKETAALAGFLPLGLLDESTIKSQMFDAIAGRAKNKSRARQTIENAIRTGRQSPARLPV